jgi:N utilization substance protein B
MYRRSRAREVALQLLFQLDLNPGTDRGAVERFTQDRLRDAPSEAYSLRLFDDVRSRTADIDAHLARAAENWRPSRMAAVDRNVLRIGTAELTAGDPAAPAAVVIDEAIELARRFGAADSPAFVNGVLDRVRKNLEAAAH